MVIPPTERQSIMPSPFQTPIAKRVSPLLFLAFLCCLILTWNWLAPWSLSRVVKAIYYKAALSHALKSRAIAVKRLTIATAPGYPKSSREREAHGPPRHVCVVARGYIKHVPRLPYFFSSLIHQPYQHISVSWVNTGEGPHDNQVDPVFKVIELIKNIDPTVNNTMQVLSLNVTDKYNAFPHLDKRVPDYGYVLTDLAVERLLRQEHVEVMESSGKTTSVEAPYCDYFLVTNSDNYYHPDFFTVLAEDMRKDYNVIGVDFMSWHGGRDRIFRNRLWSSGVDLGAVLVHRDTFDKWGMRCVRQWNKVMIIPIPPCLL